MVEMNKGQKGFANHELITLSLFLLEGDSKPIDLEEIAIKANSIAPGLQGGCSCPQQTERFLSRNLSTHSDSGPDLWAINGKRHACMGLNLTFATGR
jgi:hypothetical protein